MANVIDQLIQFAEKAERNYKYKPASAGSLITAAKVFNTVMLEDERQSTEVIRAKLDEMVNRVDIKYPKKYSNDSLITYKTRMLRLLGDFERYGTSAQAMASWSPAQIKRTAGKKAVQSASKPSKTAMQEIVSDDVIAETFAVAEATPPNHLNGGNFVADLHLPLSGDRTVVIYYPKDLSEAEADKIGLVLKSVAALTQVS